MPDGGFDPKQIEKALEGLNSGFEEFKKANDDRLTELEKKGAPDPLLDEKLSKINADLDKYQETLEKFQLAQKRSNMVEVDGKSVPREDLDQKAADWAKQVCARREKSAPEDWDHEKMKEYKSSFIKYMRDDTHSLSPEEAKTLSVGVDPDGGYTVAPDMSGRVVQRVFETSPMRQVANVQTIGTASLEGLHDLDEAGYGWVAEQGSRTNTDTPQLDRWSIPVHEMYAMPRATQKLLDDSSVDIEGWLASKVADRFARAEAAAFVDGDGAGKPRGFLTYPDYTTPGVFENGKIEQFDTGGAGAFAAAPNGADVLINAVYGLKAPYRAGAVWAMNRTTQGAVRKLKDSDGAYLWAPGIVAGQPASLLGYPVMDFEDMPTFSTDDSLAIAFGDFGEAYQIVERHGIRVLRDPYSSKPYVLFYSIRRVGGDVVNFEALKLVKFAD